MNEREPDAPDDAEGLHAADGSAMSLSTKIDWSAYRERLEAILSLPGHPLSAEEDFAEHSWTLEQRLTRKDILADAERIAGVAPLEPAVRERFLNTMQDIAQLAEGYGDNPRTWGELLDEYLTGRAPRPSVEVNWAPFDRETRDEIRKARGPEAFRILGHDEVSDDNLTPALPEGPPAITFRVELETLSTLDIDRVLSSIRKALRLALDHRPTADELQVKTDGDPRNPYFHPMRKFLLHCQPEPFRRDLERYRLHMNEGQPVRLIALREYLQTRGRDVPKEALDKPIGIKVPGEGAVLAGIKRVYEARYLRRYPGRRRRLAAPGEGVSPFACSIHNGDCDENCNNLKEWWEKTARTLPGPRSGR